MSKLHPKKRKDRPNSITAYQISIGSGIIRTSGIDTAKDVTVKAEQGKIIIEQEEKCE